jgi:hypothetical protein
VDGDLAIFENRLILDRTAKKDDFIFRKVVFIRWRFREMM